MAFTLSFARPVYRNDNTNDQSATIGGSGDGYASLKIGVHQYFTVDGSPFTFKPLNRSDAAPVCEIHDTIAEPENWTAHADIAVNIDPTGFAQTGASGWKGAYWPTAITADRCTVEAANPSTSHSIGVSLQAVTTPTHDYTNSAVKHAMILGQSGIGSIYEAGATVKNFRWKANDKALLELDNGIIRYFLVRDNKLILLRTTRSQISGDPKPEIMLYHTNAQADYIAFWANDEVGTGHISTFEMIGVASFDVNEMKWQRWGDQRALVSNGQVLQMADNDYEITFPNPKKTLRRFAVKPRANTQAEMLALQEFFEWHNNDRPFLFIDRMHKDDLGNYQEIFCKIAGEMADSTLSACLFDYGVQLTETYRDGWIPSV